MHERQFENYLSVRRRHCSMDAEEQEGRLFHSDFVNRRSQAETDVDVVQCIEGRSIECHKNDGS